jgi:hypothetical protein
MAAPFSGAAVVFLLSSLQPALPFFLLLAFAVHLPGNRPPASDSFAVHPRERAVFLL